MRWMKEVEKDLWEMNVKGWRQRAVYREEWASVINPLNAELNPICHLLALLGAHPILHVSRIRVKEAKALRGPYSQGISNIPRNYAI